ncbi:hypothetical protein, partial [Vibrio furnissii]|uniref:hypothetical protein n=3 Tax=Vibrio TaxID=662 RepID=UPI001EE9EAC4
MVYFSRYPPICCKTLQKWDKSPAKGLQCRKGFATILAIQFSDTFTSLIALGADMSSRKQLANAIRALSMDGVQKA